MQNILQDTTNVKKGKIIKSKKSEKDSVLEYLKGVYDSTIDYNLKYDLSKCIEIIEGKENQEMTDLKDALRDLVKENEELIEEKTQLYLELKEYQSQDGNVDNLEGDNLDLDDESQESDELNDEDECNDKDELNDTDEFNDDLEK
ncbi:uncharacterized protein VNE69_07037 [Vairimorpha necatrix]|uniref:Uncharacterized protein n=1 Tax=Vairimorpha necatrix TaxID=6039 RepID=A0AAX4JDM6_9MICR